MKLRYKTSMNLSSYSKGSFYMLARTLMNGAIEFAPDFTGWSRKNLIQEVQDQYGEPWEVLEGQGYLIVKFVKEVTE